MVLAIINNNFAVQAKLNADEYGVLKEDSESPYVNVIVSRENNKDEEKVQNFVKAYHSQAVEQAAEQVFKKDAIKGW